MTDSTKVAVNSHTAWGTGDHETDALIRMAGYWNSTFQDTEIIHVVEYRGELHTLTLFGHVEADEIVRAEALEIDGAKLERLSELSDESELLAEEILVEGEPVEAEAEATDGD